MVTTRRKAAAPAESSQNMLANGRANDAPVTRARPTRGRTPSAPKPAKPEVTTTQATAVATSASSNTHSTAEITKTVTRSVRTRSKQNASPLKSLEDVAKENTPSGRTPAPKARPKPATLKSKRKYGASHYTNASGRATPEPEAAQDESNDDQGMFFTQSAEHIPVSPHNDSFSFQNESVSLPNDSVSLPNDSISPEIDYFSCQYDPVHLQDNPVSPYASPLPSKYANGVPAMVRLAAANKAEDDAPRPRFTGQVSSDTVVEARLRQENFQLRAIYHSVDERNLRLVGDNMDLKVTNRYLEHLRDSLLVKLADLHKRLPPTLQTGQVQANPQPIDIDTFGMTDKAPEDTEVFVGSEAAVNLLNHVIGAAQAPRTAQPDNDESDVDIESSSHEPLQRLSHGQGETSRSASEVTPLRPLSKPSSFFSRSFSAIKSKLGFSTPNPPEPSPTAPPTSRAPPPDNFTEVLSAPPTPVGERRKTRPRKIKQNPMLKLLTKGVEPADMAKAEKWAKDTIPTLKNFPDFAAKRKRLETPVLVQDLEHFPSSKPWESGFGDPLAEMDDEEVVPVWAVVLEILKEEEEPKRKKTKASHEVSMNVDDTLSINDMAAQRLHDSHGHSASQLDFHPRRSVEPSPMFGSPSPHQPGSNIFGELHGHDAVAKSQTNDRETLHEATKDVVHNHNPSQGSFGLDYGSDDEDSTIIEETSDADVSASPLWTQAPPPAPVPAHAPLPGGATAATPPVAAEMPSPPAEQPVDEVERQRQKLMKHTPAKPSRLREAFVPSPSVLSDAGNQSLFLGTPVAATDLFDDMPEAEDLELTAEEWAGVQAITNSAEWKAETATPWPDPIMEYGSEEEDLSPV